MIAASPDSLFRILRGAGHEGLDAGLQSQTAAKRANLSGGR